MKKAFVTVFMGAVFAVACAGGVKGIENSGKKLGDDVKDAPLTKDLEEGGTKLGNEVADASVTKDVSEGANKVGDDVSGKDAGAPATATKPTPAKKKKPKK
jgi:hypothetical protein